MPHAVLIYPPTVYPGEADAECPEAKPLLDVLIRVLQQHGPSPPGYAVKNLGAQKDQLWQINLRAGGGRQVRVLYAPYKDEIVLFRIHKKSSGPEQQRAYELAIKRKRAFEAQRKIEEKAKQGAQRYDRNSKHH